MPGFAPPEIFPSYPVQRVPSVPRATTRAIVTHRLHHGGTAMSDPGSPPCVLASGWHAPQSDEGLLNNHSSRRPRVVGYSCSAQHFVRPWP